MSKEQQAQAQPQVAIPLPKAKKNLVQIGCICMMLSVAMYGLVFATLTAPILEKVDAMGYVGLFSIVGAIGVSIMTPIGGKPRLRGISCGRFRRGPPRHGRGRQEPSGSAGCRSRSGF